MSESNSMSELDLIKKECAEMVETLKKMHEEETELSKENEILAQQGVLAGSRGEIEKRGKNKKPVSSLAAEKKSQPTKSTAKPADSKSTKA